MSNHKYNLVSDQVMVEYLPGSGGRFLKLVLASCMTNSAWVPMQRVNFHNREITVLGNHHYEPANNIIGIDSSNARYNFWLNYFKKRVLHELTKYTYQGNRWIKCPDADSDVYHDGYWLLNQCRFIIDYKSIQPWKIDWVEMLQNPEASWQTIQEFLTANNQPNYWNLDQWILAVNDYKKTVFTNIKINPAHRSWQIWAVALLQEQGITPNFNLIDNFRSPCFFQWLNEYQQDLVELTKKTTFNLG